MNNDPEGSIGFILKPPSNFETVYQGQSRTIPIPFVAQSLNNQFLALDDLAGKEGVASNLLRFVPVSLGSSVMILIPRALYQDSDNALRAPAYVYDFRWRLRSVADYAEAVQNGNPTHPYQLISTEGAPSIPSPTARRVIPAYTSDQVTPTVVGSTRRPLITASTFSTVSQGIYNPADFAGAGDPTAGDDALGITYFPPYIRLVRGNELGIVATFPTGTWDFGNTGASGDAAFSNVYGTNVAGATQHPAYPGVGIIVIQMITPTAP